MRVSDLMNTSIMTAHATDSLSRAVKLIKENNIKHLPVTDSDGRLVGIVTDRDLKRASASDATLLEVHELLYLLDKVKLSEVMTKSPVSVTPETLVSEAARIAVENRVGCLPVLENGKLTGIVTNSDFLKFLARGEEALRAAG